MSKNTPTLSKENISTLIHTINKFGDVIIEIGKLEQEVGALSQFQEIFEKNIFGIVSDLEARPKISEKLGQMLVRFVSLSIYMKKDFDSIEPEEKIKAGKIIKEIAQIMKEISEEYDKE